MFKQFAFYYILFDRIENPLSWIIQVHIATFVFNLLLQISTQAGYLLLRAGFASLTRRPTENPLSWIIRVRIAFTFVFNLLLQISTQAGYLLLRAGFASLTRRPTENPLCHSFFNRNGTCNCCTYHWVVTHTYYTHHFYVSRN